MTPPCVDGGWAAIDRMPTSGPDGAGHPIVEEDVAMWERVQFESEITLTKTDVLDLVARCEEAVERAESVGEAELAFRIEGLRRFLLGRLMGEATAPDS